MRPPVSHPHSCTFLSFKFSFKNFICATCTVTALGVELWMRIVCASAKIPTKVLERERSLGPDLCCQNGSWLRMTEFPLKTKTMFSKALKLTKDLWDFRVG